MKKRSPLRCRTTWLGCWFSLRPPADSACRRAGPAPVLGRFNQPGPHRVALDVTLHGRIRKAIIDKDVKVPPNTTIGYDLEHDRQRGFQITEQGVIVIAKAELPETFAERARR